MTPHRLPSPRLLARLTGLSLALGLALSAAPVLGDSEGPRESGRLSTLVKFEDRSYEITYEDWVSLEPESTASVRKIGYGRVSEVNIATTATGTYSSDAMTSPHVLYPGIESRRVHEGPAIALAGTGRLLPEPPGGSSIRILSRSGNATILTTLRQGVLRSCVRQASILSCPGR